jgi:hypothetical protein
MTPANSSVRQRIARIAMEVPKLGVLCITRYKALVAAGEFVNTKYSTIRLAGRAWPKALKDWEC